MLNDLLHFESLLCHLSAHTYVVITSHHAYTHKQLCFVLLLKNMEKKSEKHVKSVYEIPNKEELKCDLIERK